LSRVEQDPIQLETGQAFSSLRGKGKQENFAHSRDKPSASPDLFDFYLSNLRENQQYTRLHGEYCRKKKVHRSSRIVFDVRAEFRNRIEPDRPLRQLRLDRAVGIEGVRHAIDHA
jgi:hypothetical protein